MYLYQFAEIIGVMSDNKPGLICNLFMGTKLRLEVRAREGCTIHCAGVSPYQKFTDLFRELVLFRAHKHRCFRRINPKSEIETGNLTQSLGHKRIEKISTDHFGYASIFFDLFLLQDLASSCQFEFRISGLRQHTRPRVLLSAPTPNTSVATG